MERPTILSEIRKEIQNAKIGTVFVPIDFALITDKKKRKRFALPS